jgi:hypothetical protein
MSTAADDLDGPVIIFTSLAIAIAMGVGVWCNFFYGWYFSQTFVVLLAPGMVAAYVLVLLLKKDWHFQPIATDFKTQISFACLGLLAAMMVLTAVATAVSTRLGQVMTIVACSGVFVFGLLSNYFIGRHAFSNQSLGRILDAAPVEANQEGWPEPGSVYKVLLYSPPSAQLRPGDPFYYAPSADGFPMSVPAYPRFTGDLARGTDLMNPDLRGLAVQSVSGSEVRVVRFGGAPLQATRPPEKNDYAFLAPSKVNFAALGIWSIVPNMHYFWLVDAVSQNQPIPPRHMALIGGYAVCQVAAFLALGIILFQKRDVG